MTTTGIVISDDSNNNDTTSDGSITDETTRVDTIGDESKVSKYPVIHLRDFIAFLLKLLLGSDVPEFLDYAW